MDVLCIIVIYSIKRIYALEKEYIFIEIDLDRK